MRMRAKVDRDIADSSAAACASQHGLPVDQQVNRVGLTIHVAGSSRCLATCLALGDQRSSVIHVFMR